MVTAAVNTRRNCCAQTAVLVHNTTIVESVACGLTHSFELAGSRMLLPAQAGRPARTHHKEGRKEGREGGVKRARRHHTRVPPKAGKAVYVRACTQVTSQGGVRAQRATTGVIYRTPAHRRCPTSAGCTVLSGKEIRATRYEAPEGTIQHYPCCWWYEVSEGMMHHTTRAAAVCSNTCFVHCCCASRLLRRCSAYCCRRTPDLSLVLSSTTK